LIPVFSEFHQAFIRTPEGVRAILRGNRSSENGGAAEMWDGMNLPIASYAARWWHGNTDNEKNAGCQ
jgi:hypothetical protein